MIPIRSTRRKITSPLSQISSNNPIFSISFNRLEIQHMRSFTRVIKNSPPCVEHENGSLSSFKWYKSLQWSLQVAPSHYGLVDMGGVTPRHRERPVRGSVVTNRLLQKSRLVDRPRRHQVIDCGRAVHVWEDGID